MGQRIKAYRKAAGLTQTVVALKLGQPYQNYQRYERGTAAIPADRLIDLARVLGVTMDDLVPPPRAKSGKVKARERIIPDTDEQELIRQYRQMDPKLKGSLMAIAKAIAASLPSVR